MESTIRFKSLKYLAFVSLLALSFSQETFSPIFKNNKNFINELSLPDSIENLNYALGGEIQFAALVGKDSIIIGKTGDKTLYLHDINNNITSQIKTNISPVCSGCDSNLDFKILQKFGKKIYMVGELYDDNGNIINTGLSVSEDLGKSWSLLSNGIFKEYIISDSTIFYFKNSGIETVIMSANIKTPNVSNEFLKISDFYPSSSYTHYAKIHVANGLFGFSYRYLNSNSEWETGLAIKDLVNEASELVHYKYPVKGMYIDDFYPLNADTIVALTYGTTELFGIKYLKTNTNTWEHKSTIFGDYLVSLSKTKYFVSGVGRTPLPMVLYDSELDKKITRPIEHNYSKKGFIRLDENRVFAFGKKNPIIIDYENANPDNVSSVKVSDVKINYNFSSYRSIFEIDADNLIFINENPFEIIKINKNTNSVEDLSAEFFSSAYYNPTLFRNQNYLYHFLNGSKKVNIYNLSNISVSTINLITDKKLQNDFFFVDNCLFFLGYKDEDNKISTSLLRYDIEKNILEEFNLELGEMDNEWFQNHSRFHAQVDSIVFFTNLYRTYGSGRSNQIIHKNYYFNNQLSSLKIIDNDLVLANYVSNNYTYNITKIDGYYFLDKNNNQYGPDLKSKDLVEWYETEIEPYNYTNGISYFFKTEDFELAYAPNYGNIFYKKGNMRWKELTITDRWVGRFNNNSLSPLNKSISEKNKIYIAPYERKPLSVNLNLLPLNSSPVIKALTDVTVKEDEFSTITLSATDVDGDAITYSAVSDTNAVAASISSDTLTLTLKADWNGIATITAYALDGSLKDSTSFTLTVTPVNDAPVIAAVSNDSTTEETEKIIVLDVSDVDGDALIYTSTSDTSGVAITISSDTLKLTPALNFTGTSAITVIVSDNELTDTTKFDFKVINVNDAPVIASVSDVTINEDDTLSILISATDIEGEAIHFGIDAGSLPCISCRVSTTLSGTDTLTIIPFADWNGEAIIKVVATDLKAEDSTSFKLTVNPVQDAPTPFAWTSTLTDSIQIKKDNLSSTYDLVWDESKDVDGDTIVYMVYAKVGDYEMEEILDTTATSYSIPYSEIIEVVFTEQPIDKATVRFTVWASDGTDSVKVDGEDRVLFVDIYQYLSTKEDLTPTEFALHDNYPNPFNPTTQIRFDLPQVTDATLTIYNMMGQKIRTFSMSSLPAGYHNVTWNATNDYGQQVSAGVYLYQLQTKGFMRTKKMILLK